MIPVDNFTILLLALLVIIGVIGLIAPRLFHSLSRFPFITMPHTPYDDAARRRARVWGVISLVGAAVTALFMEW